MSGSEKSGVSFADVDRRQLRRAERPPNRRQARQQPSNRECRGHAHGDGRRRFVALARVPNEPREHVGRHGEERVAVGGERQSGRLADEQRASIVGLELLNLAAHRALRAA